MIFDTIAALADYRNNRKFDCSASIPQCEEEITYSPLVANHETLTLGDKRLLNNELKKQGRFAYEMQRRTPRYDYEEEVSNLESSSSLSLSSSGNESSSSLSQSFYSMSSSSSCSCSSSSCSSSSLESISTSSFSLASAETFSTKLVASDAAAYDWFANSTAISGDYIIEGAPYRNSYFGGAYIYNRTGTNTWDTGTLIVSADAAANDDFGWSVGISGDYAIVGARGKDGDTGNNVGVAYIFNRSGLNAWDAGVKIVASDGAPNDAFGHSVAISGDYAVVGAPIENSGTGAAYVYLRTGLNTWDAGVKIVASDPQGSDNFGQSVSISGDYIIVGANAEDAGGSNAGAAYIFHRTGTNTWSAATKIVANDAGAGDFFGWSVGISGDYAVVGATRENGYRGAAYVYHRTGTNTWDAGTKIVARDPESNAEFGDSVAISGDYVIVGASYKKDGAAWDVGSAYLYHRSGTNSWNAGTKIMALDAAEPDRFGWSIAIDGNYAVVGAFNEDAGGTQAGAAYVEKFTIL